MSLELHDLGSLKIHQRDRSYLKAKAKSLGIELPPYIRQLVHEAVQRDLDILQDAIEIHEAKGLGNILKDAE